jgi:hypothetical protein
MNSKGSICIEPRTHLFLPRNRLKSLITNTDLFASVAHPAEAKHVMSQVECSLQWGNVSNNPHSYSIQKGGVSSGRLRSSYLLKNGPKVYLSKFCRKVDFQIRENWMVQVGASVQLSCRKFEFLSLHVG